MAGETYGKNWLTPKNIVIYLIVGGLVYGAVYYLFLGKKGSSLYTPPPVSTQEQSTLDSTPNSTMEVALSAQNDSGENGTATLTESDGKTTVTIELDNAPATPQPAHIHVGSCPTPGDVNYPLTNVVNGTSETVLNVDLATLRSNLPLALNVHKSAMESKTYVSCGDLN